MHCSGLAGGRVWQPCSLCLCVAVDACAPRDDLRQASAAVTAQASAHVYVLPSLDVLGNVAGCKEELAAAATELRKAAVTKCEALLAQALARADSKKTAERVRAFTAECSNAVGDDWKNHVHPDFVRLAQAELDKTPRKAKAAADRTS